MLTSFKNTERGLHCAARVTEIEKRPSETSNNENDRFCILKRLVWYLRKSLLQKTTSSKKRDTYVPFEGVLIFGTGDQKQLPPQGRLLWTSPIIITSVEIFSLEGNGLEWQTL